MTLVNRHRVTRHLDIDSTIADEHMALILAWQDGDARTLQHGLGPSEIGQCPEYIRAHVSGDPGVPDGRYRGAANVGTAIGSLYEDAILQQEPDARKETPITVQLPRTKLKVSGHADLIRPSALNGRGTIEDLKSKDGFATVSKDGASFQNLVQLSGYHIGAVQQGILTTDSIAVLWYVDRSGSEKEFRTASWDYAESLRYVELAEQNLEAVMVVLSKQHALEAAGREPLEIREILEPDRAALRDEKPSTCYAFQCPFRDACWGKSDIRPTGKIEDENAIRAIDNYDSGREMKKMSEKLMLDANRLLGQMGISGITPSGKILAWQNTGRVDPDGEAVKRISVTKA